MTKKFQTSLYLLLFLYLILNAFVEGFRMPNLWSINYYLPSFFDGFYRRALPGTFLSILGNYKFNYYVVASIQFSILLSLVIWMFIIFKKSFLTLFIVTVYLFSACGGYLFHEVGYIDQLLYLILFISILLFNYNKLLSIVLFSSSILVHELALFVTVPLFFTFIYMRTANLKKSFFYILPSLFIFGIIYLFFQTVPLEKIHIFTEKIQEYSNYSYRKDFYTIFINDFTGTRTKIYYTSSSLVPLLLLFLSSIIMGMLSYQIQKNKILSLLIILSGLSPLLLGIFGWDLSRWYFLSFTSSIIVFTLFVLHYNVAFMTVVNKKMGGVLIICYTIVISNLTLNYFDGYKPRQFHSGIMEEIKQELLMIPKI